MEHPHRQLCKKLLEDPEGHFHVPDYTSLDDIIAATAHNAHSTATQRQQIAKRALLFKPAGADAAAKRKSVAQHIAKYYTTLSEDPLFGPLRRLFVHTGEDKDADIREEAAIAALNAWLGKGPEIGSAFKKLEAIPGAAQKLRVDLQTGDAEDQPHTLLNQLLDYLLAGREPEPAQAPADLPADFFAKDAKLLLQAGVAAAAPNPPPAAAAAASPPEQPPAAAGAGEPRYTVIARHPDATPALAVANASSHSRTTIILQRICEAGNTDRKLLLQLVTAIADAGEPSGVGTCTPARDFLFDASQKVGGVPYTAQQDKEPPTVWDDPFFRIRDEQDEHTGRARDLLTAFCMQESFDPNASVNGQSCSRCLVIDAQALDRFDAIGGLHEMGHGGARAVAHICRDMLGLTDTSVRHRQPLRPGMDTTYQLYDTAFSGNTRAVIRSSVEAAIDKATQLARITSKSRRDRLLIAPLGLLMSRSHIDAQVWPVAQNLAQRRWCPEEDAANAVWQTWMARLVGSATLPLFVRRGQMTEWTEHIGVRSTQPHRPSARAADLPLPEPPSVSAPAGRQQPAGPAPLPAAQTAHGDSARTDHIPTAYACQRCGKGNHHLADCYELRGKHATEAWLRSQFDFNVHRLAQGFPAFPAALTGRFKLPPDIDSSWDTFARRVAANTKKSKKRGRGE